MPYLSQVPQPGDFLSDSQGDLLGNMQQLDISFGVDHYTFSNLTADNGKHNQITTPNHTPAGHPSTAANEPKFYAMQDSTPLGVIQYSRGPSDAVPTPVTYLHSGAPATLASAATINLLDFTGLTLAIVTVMGSGSLGGVVNDVFWNGTGFNIVNQGGVTTVRTQATGNILEIRNGTAAPSNNFFWTLVLHRIQA